MKIISGVILSVYRRRHVQGAKSESTTSFPPRNLETGKTREDKLENHNVRQEHQPVLV